MQQMKLMRQMIALFMLAICAYTDIKKKYIYLVPLVICAVGGSLIVLTAYFAIPEYTGVELTNDLITPALAGTVLILLAKCADRYIGSGDGYLMAALGILIGNRCNLYVAAVGSVLASGYAFVMLVRKKKRFMSSIPFAPFVMAGFVMVTAYEI